MNNIHSERIAIESGGDTFGGVLVRSTPLAPRILLFHAWWGLTPIFQDQAERLAREGFTVFAPDLYDGKTVSTIPDAEAMEDFRVSGRPAFIATAAVRWMQEQPSNYPGLGCVGFSMGGGWALELAGKFPGTVKAVVLYYASGEADYSKVRAHLLGHFGALDEWTPEAEVAIVENSMNAHGVVHQFFRYPHAEHWFVENNRPEYRAEDAALAWQRSVKFLQEELKE